MRNQEWYASLAQLHPLDFAQLVFRLFSCDTMDGKAAFSIIDQAEVLAGLLDGDDVHVASRIGRIRAHFAVNFDETLHHDCLYFAAVECILETVGNIAVSIQPLI